MYSENPVIHLQTPLGGASSVFTMNSKANKVCNLIAHLMMGEARPVYPYCCHCGGLDLCPHNVAIVRVSP